MQVKYLLCVLEIKVKSKEPESSSELSGSIFTKELLFPIYQFDLVILSLHARWQPDVAHHNPRSDTCGILRVRPYKGYSNRLEHD